MGQQRDTSEDRLLIRAERILDRATNTAARAAGEAACKRVLRDAARRKLRMFGTLIADMPQVRIESVERAAEEADAALDEWERRREEWEGATKIFAEAVAAYATVKASQRTN